MRRQKPGPKPTEGLTDAEQRVLDEIFRQIKRQHAFPTSREVAERLELAQPYVHRIFQRLAEKKCLREPRDWSMSPKGMRLVSARLRGVS